MERARHSQRCARGPQRRPTAEGLWHERGRTRGRSGERRTRFEHDDERRERNVDDDPRRRVDHDDDHSRRRFDHNDDDK
jgi:hypothetical protein